MKTVTHFIGSLFLYLFLGFGLAYASQDQTSPVGVIPKDVYEDYLLFLNGRSLEAINYYGGSHARRDVIETVLIQQALAYGGFSEQVEFKQVESYARQLVEVYSGRAALTLTTVWKKDSEGLNDGVYVSAPMVLADEFIAGIYVRPDNERALNSHSLQDLSRLKAVSNPSWRRDWDLLRSFMPEGALYSSALWVSMVRMVNVGRVDFLLAPFQATEDLSLHFEDAVLMPIPGIKLSLNESRHIIISKTHPSGEELYDALTKGLAYMRSQGLIRKAYSESGFFNERVLDWKLLTP